MKSYQKRLRNANSARTEWYVLAIMILGLGLTACNKKQLKEGGAVGKATAKMLISELEESSIQYDWFSSKTRMHFNNGQMKQSFTANIRMRRDSVVWLSLTGPFGIEGARVLMTTDSIRIINHLGREYISKPISFVQEYVPVDLGIADVQKILVGESLRTGRSKYDLQMEDEYHVLNTEKSQLDFTYWMHPSAYTVDKFRLKNEADQQELLISFTNYKETDSRTFAFDRDYHFKDPAQDVQLSASFSKVKFDEPTTFPFNPPSRYKQSN